MESSLNEEQEQPSEEDNEDSLQQQLVQEGSQEDDVSVQLQQQSKNNLSNFRPLVNSSVDAEQEQQCEEDSRGHPDIQEGQMDIHLHTDEKGGASGRTRASGRACARASGRAGGPAGARARA